MKKRVLTLMVTMLAMMMLLVACGDSKETSSDSEKEKKEKVEAEIETDIAKDDKTNQEYSGDGGAPVDGEEPATNTEPDTEVVEPVATTFTLVDEDGTVVFEGSIPADLTLVDGNGTSHIEFAYNSNSDVSVYLDAGLDYDVFSAYKCNHYDNNGDIPTATLDFINKAVEFYAITEADLGFAENKPYMATRSLDDGYPMLVNNTYYGIMMAELDNYIYYDIYTNTYVLKRYDGYNYTNVDIDASNNTEFGYAIWKGCVFGDKTNGGFLANPFTISLKVTQPDFNSLSEDERNLSYYAINGYSEFSMMNGRSLLEQIIKSFSN